MNINDLKNKSNLLAKIKNKVESSKSSGGYEDERFWKPTFDKETGGGAIIRFLPSPDGVDAMPYEKVVTHFFKGPTGKWYTEKSLRTFDKKDPVADLNYRLFNTNIESNQNQARNQKQKPRWTANILVINDTGAPENNGKVFLYEFGPSIWNLIEEQLFPKDPTNPDKEPVNPFDVFEAPNLNIRLIPKKLGSNVVPNYDKSDFDRETTQLRPTAEEIVEVINKGHSLAEFKDESNFKTFDELADKLVEVLGLTTGTGLETVVGYEAANAYTGKKEAPKSTPAANTNDEKFKELEKELDGPFGGDTGSASVTEDEDPEMAKLKAILQGD